jgi:hypothetical protein
MLPTWIIEAGVFGKAAEPLAEEVRRQGMTCLMVPYREVVSGLNGTAGEAPGERECVLFYGSHPLMHHIRKHRPGWVPGGWCSFENLACSTYYAYFGPYLLNQPYAMLPGVEAIRHADHLYGVYGRDGVLFARPDSVEKVFTGRLIRRDEFANALAPTRYDPATLVVVARPRSIAREWRLVVVEGRVVAGCQYFVQGQPEIRVGCPAEVQSFATGLLHEVGWRPDPAFMMDVCEVEGDLRLLELNSFSCSGLYACDPATVVASASRLAQVEWERPRAGC